MENYLELLSGDLRILGLGEFFESLIAERQTSSRKIAKHLRIPYRSLRNYMANSRGMPLSIAFSIIHAVSINEPEEFDLKSQLFEKVSWIKSTSSSSQQVRLPKQHSRELAYLIGAIHDGTVFANEKKNQYVIQYWQHNNPHWLNTIVRYLKAVFGYEPKRYDEYVQLSHKAVYEFFAKVIKVPRYQRNWDSFLDIPRAFQIPAIIGMFDAEGWVGNQKDLRIKFSQKNKKKLNEIKRVLLEHGIKSGKVIPENEAYALWLCGKSSIDFATMAIRFCEHRNKRQKLIAISQYDG